MGVLSHDAQHGLQESACRCWRFQIDFKRMPGWPSSDARNPPFPARHDGVGRVRANCHSVRTWRPRRWSEQIFVNQNAFVCMDCCNFILHAPAAHEHVHGIDCDGIRSGGGRACYSRPHFRLVHGYRLDLLIGNRLRYRRHPAYQHRSSRRIRGEAL